MTDAKQATLEIDGKTYTFPLVVGTEGEVGIDVAALRKETKAVTLDPGYGNTGSCKSAITFIDGDKGILRYRGYPIEQLAEKATFDEVIHLLVFGSLPNEKELEELRRRINEKSKIQDRIAGVIKAMPKDMHPMAMLASATVSLACGCEKGEWGVNIEEDIIRMLGQFKGVVSYIGRLRKGEEFIPSKQSGSYTEDFVHMMFGKNDPTFVKAFDQLLVLHADHEQNCSTSTVRMVGSSMATLPASICAGVNALSGPLHGGANQSVIEQLEAIRQDGGDVEKYVEMAKDKSSGFRLMGFGHRVYRHFDPRATIIKKACDVILDSLGIEDDGLKIARRLEKAALEDEYFVTRRLYPNVDFYSGIIYRALGIPVDMFTVMFALGRLPGWIAQWKELREDPKGRIHRPRQIYVGERERNM